MAETDTTFSSFSSHFDSNVIFPPSSSDQALFGNSSSDLRILIGGDGGFELTFDMISISSSSHESGKMVVDQKLEKEEATTTYKRKLEVEEDTRNNKYRRLNQEDDERKNARLIKNRESAQLSRRRKKHYIEELEDKVKILHSTIKDLNSKVSSFMAENTTLRQQVSSGRPCHRAALVPMAYPWMPCPGYMVKPPLVLPIPRLKPQQSLVKVKKKKTKKVASVSVLGVLFCLFLFGVLASIVKISYGEYESSFDQSRGRVLGRDVSDTEYSVSHGSSEPLVASLFVPRNDKLVKIDGSLIIRSVLASEKAMTASEMKNDEGKSGVATTTTSTAANVRMQQWFREGVTGPMFSSGICTQVFQFDVSSTSGDIIPASTDTQQPKNTTVVTQKGKNSRRLLRSGLPVSDFNLTKDDNSSSKENFRETKTAASMVVSVLVDPREGSDGDYDGKMGGMKSLSRVFIVVLVDSVKYVTYSCNLPQPEVHQQDLIQRMLGNK